MMLSNAGSADLVSPLEPNPKSNPFLLGKDTFAISQKTGSKKRTLNEYTEEPYLPYTSHGTNLCPSSSYCKFRETGILRFSLWVVYDGYLAGCFYDLAVEKYRNKWLSSLTRSEMEVARRCARELLKEMFNVEFNDEAPKKDDEKAGISKWVCYWRHSRI
jgi:hypothetical protein